MTPEAPILEVRGLRKHFPIRKGLLRRTVGHVRAVDGVSFTIRRGETLALVGVSGCGKTTVSRCILRAQAPSAGEMRFEVGGRTVDLATLPRRELRPLRRHLQMVFQDPYSSLNPRMVVGDIIGEPLLINGMTDRAERRKRSNAPTRHRAPGHRAGDRRRQNGGIRTMRWIGHASGPSDRWAQHDNRGSRMRSAEV